MILTKDQKNSIATGSTNRNIKNVSQSVLSDNAKAQSKFQANKTTGGKTNSPAKLQESDNNISIIKYPDDLAEYYIGFSFSEYTRPKFNVRPTKSIKADISLPIPNNLTDYLEARWDEQELGLLGHATDLGRQVGGVLGGLAGAVGYAYAEQKFQNNFQLRQDNLKKIASEVGRQNGYAFNPYLAIYYNGPRFKKHRFSWRFSPKHPGESRDIVKIIKQFHHAMSPELTPLGIFFKYPYIVQPKLFNGPTQNDFLYDFKPCIIENMIVNYAPSGIPSFFAGTKAPTEIEFQLFLSEINLWLKEDYAD